MKKLFASKEIRKVIRQAMSKSQRKWMDEGEIFSVRIIKVGKEMKRWGADSNTAKIAVGGKNCRIYRNNLIEFAWSYDPEKAAIEATHALDYFIDGECKVVIC